MDMTKNNEDFDVKTSFSSFVTYSFQKC